MFKTISIIVISVSIFGLILFLFCQKSNEKEELNILSQMKMKRKINLNKFI